MCIEETINVAAYVYTTEICSVTNKVIVLTVLNTD